MTYQKYCFNGGDEIVNNFAQYFSSIYNNSIMRSSTPNLSRIVPVINYSYLNLFVCVLNPTDFLNGSDNVTFITNPGPDMIPSTYFLFFLVVNLS